CRAPQCNLNYATQIPSGKRLITPSPTSLRAPQLPPNSFDWSPRRFHIERPQELWLQERQLVHPGVGAHGNEERSIRRNRARLRYGRDLLADELAPLRYDPRLFHATGESAPREKTGDNVRDRLGFG